MTNGQYFGLPNAALSREPERVCGEVAAVDELSRAGARSIENRTQRDFRACEQGLACGSRKAASLRAVAFREPRQTAPEAPRRGFAGSSALLC